MMHSQVDGFVAGLVAWASLVISFVFDVPAPYIVAAFIGSCFAVAVIDPVPYRKAGLLVIMGTVLAGLLLPLVTHLFGLGDTPQRGLSALLAFGLIVKREQIPTALDWLIRKRRS